MDINLDNHTATKICKTVSDFLGQDHEAALAHSPHKLGVQGYQYLVEALDVLAAKEIFPNRENLFFSSLQEALHTLYLSFYINEISETGKNQILLLEIEDAPLFFAAERLKSLGCTVKTVSLNKNGLIDLEALKKAITPKTSFFSFSMAHSLTGVIQPVEEILKICKDKGVKVHLELTHAFGKIPCNFESDFATFSAHLIHGKKGACISSKRKDFFSQNETTSIPLWSQDPIEAKAFSLAVRQALLFSDKMSLDVPRLKKQFEKKLLDTIPEVEVLFVKNSLPNVSVIYFPKVHAEALLYYLNKKGLFASFGGGVSQPLFSIIEKLHLEAKYRYSSLSFAFSRYTTKMDLEKAVDIIYSEVTNLQILSKDL